MPKNKTISKQDLISLYMDYVLANNSEPISVYSFSKLNNFDEGLFYNYFGNFKALERHIFMAFFKNTIVTLEKSEDYQNFDARNKLLSFYYTFFENLTINRSYVVYTLKNFNKNLKSLEKLSSLRKQFKNYISLLDIETFNINYKNIQQLKDKTLEESAWIQLMITLNFWLNDASASFEKTDIFIEKSVNTSFDLINTQPLNSVIDLGKFLFKEKCL
ncbi:hypothetical protein NA63_2556 [Flavobacteriaceae bacterium MAR_2010_105]|nr:hypothetical protein NA63_2556 [Flavobacteriaceae bacterium MAR_2010_105]